MKQENKDQGLFLSFVDCRDTGQFFLSGYHETYLEEGVEVRSECE